MGQMDNGKSAPTDVLKTATLKSLNEDVVKVLSNGKLIAVAPGIAPVEITVGNIKKIINITVNEAAEAELLYITLSQRVTTFPEGNTIRFVFGGDSMANKTISITGVMSNGQNASGATLQSGATYVSNDISIATVTPDGIVTAVAEGDCQVKITVQGVEAVLNVNVQAATLSALNLDQSNVTVNIGDTVTPIF